MKVGVYGTHAETSVTFRVSLALRDRIVDAARKAGVTTSQWLRETIERRLKGEAADQP